MNKKNNNSKSIDEMLDEVLASLKENHPDWDNERIIITANSIMASYYNSKKSKFFLIEK